MKRVHKVVPIGEDDKIQLATLRVEHDKIAQTIRQLQASMKAIWKSMQEREKELIAKNAPKDFTLGPRQYGSITDDGFIVYLDSGDGPRYRPEMTDPDYVR